MCEHGSMHGISRVSTLSKQYMQAVPLSDVAAIGLLVAAKNTSKTDQPFVTSTDALLWQVWKYKEVTI